jgi:hypothetical protein
MRSQNLIQYLFCRVVLFCLLWPNLASAQSYKESRYLAVLEVETSAEIFEEIGVDVLKLIAEEMRNGARMTTRAAEIKWVIMTTDSLPEIMRRQNLDPEACDEADCAVQTGQAIGANLLVETHLAKSGGRWLLKVTLHDVDSAGFRGSEHILHQGDIWDMIEAAGQLNRGLLRQYMTPEELAENRMPQVSQTAQLTVKSIRGAIPVLVNGEPRGNTPLQLDLSSGRHYIQVAPSSCWEGPQVEVNLQPNEQKTRYLNPIARDVTVEISAIDRRGNAIAAAVAVDGERLGTTPDRFKVSACAQELVTTYVGKTRTTNLEQYLRKQSSGVARIQVKHFTRGPSRSTYRKDARPSWRGGVCVGYDPACPYLTGRVGVSGTYLGASLSYNVIGGTIEAHAFINPLATEEATFIQRPHAYVALSRIKPQWYTYYSLGVGTDLYLENSGFESIVLIPRFGIVRGLSGTNLIANFGGSLTLLWYFNT